MKRRSLRIGVCVGFFALVGTSGPWALAASKPAAPPASKPAAPASAPKASAAGELRSQAIKRVLSGTFDEGLAALRKAIKQAPDDADTAAALKLLEGHMALRRRFQKERDLEFERAAARARRSTLTEKYFSAEGGEQRKKKLREKVADVTTAYLEVEDHEALLDGKGRQEAEKLKTASIASLDRAAAALAGAVKVLRKDDSEFVRTFRDLAARLKDRLDKHRAAWRAVDAATPKGRRQGARALKLLEDDLADAVNDVDAMVAEKPWRVAMTHARLAREITPSKEAMKRHGWYRQLVGRIEDRARAAVEDAKWYDALAAYAGLKELDPDNEEYEERLKAVRRRVRVLRLYGSDGSPDANSATTAPSKSRWQEISDNVDMDTVRTVISQLDDYYVAAVDYRKVIYGALRGVRTLAETPEATKAFPGLADAKEKEKFLSAVRRELTTVIKKDRVDHMNLLLALTSIVLASEDSVRIPTSVLVMEFADGFLDELDRFSSIIWPYDVDDFRKQTMGKFFGVGIQITKQRGQPLKVVTPLANSPAFRAGVKTGDLIVAVDGRRTEDLAIDKLVRMITGKKGTKVVLRIKRPGQRKTTDFEIIRKEIRIRTVKGWRRMPGGDGGQWDYLIDRKNKVGYIRVTQFYEQTHAHLAQVLKAMKARGVRSLVLDLRINPGGLLESAKRVSDEFLVTGKIVSTKGRQKREQVLHAGPLGNYLTGDLVVLVDQHSASAAEIVSGAIHDLGRGIILGKRTFGKGSVQNVIPIPRHRAYLKLTTAYYYLPSGRCLHRRNGDKEWGVEPDVDVHVTPRQKRRWLGIRRKANLLKEVDPEELAQDLAEEYEADLQLQTAVLFLRLMQIRDKRPATRLPTLKPCDGGQASAVILPRPRAPAVRAAGPASRGAAGPASRGAVGPGGRPRRSSAPASRPPAGGCG